MNKYSSLQAERPLISIPSTSSLLHTDSSYFFSMKPSSSRSSGSAPPVTSSPFPIHLPSHFHPPDTLNAQNSVFKASTGALQFNNNNGPSNQFSLPEEDQESLSSLSASTSNSPSLAFPPTNSPDISSNSGPTSCSGLSVNSSLSSSPSYSNSLKRDYEESMAYDSDDYFESDSDDGYYHLRKQIKVDTEDPYDSFDYAYPLVSPPTSFSPSFSSSFSPISSPVRTAPPLSLNDFNTNAPFSASSAQLFSDSPSFPGTCSRPRPSISSQTFFSSSPTHDSQQLSTFSSLSYSSSEADPELSCSPSLSCPQSLSLTPPDRQCPTLHPDRGMDEERDSDDSDNDMDNNLKDTNKLSIPRALKFSKKIKKIPFKNSNFPGDSSLMEVILGKKNYSKRIDFLCDELLKKIQFTNSNSPDSDSEEEAEGKRGPLALSNQAGFDEEIDEGKKLKNNNSEGGVNFFAVQPAVSLPVLVPPLASPLSSRPSSCEDFEEVFDQFRPNLTPPSPFTSGERTHSDWFIEPVTPPDTPDCRDVSSPPDSDSDSVIYVENLKNSMEEG